MSRLSDSLNGLILRVHRRDGAPDEIYVAPGMTIGRNVANTVELAGDMSVDREHARAEVDEEGSHWLCCRDPVNTILQDGTKLSKIKLEPGKQFKIGDTDFECLLDSRTGKSVPAKLDTSQSFSRGCPYCHDESVPLTDSGPRCCPTCGHEVLPIDNVCDNGDVVLVPVIYGSLHRLWGRDVQDNGDEQVVPVNYGRFRAESFVARGGMGVVLKGHGESDALPVAIKLLPVSSCDLASQERFQREIDLLSQIQHPNVVRLFDSGTEAGHRYLVMEWIEGETLKDKITQFFAASRLVSFDEALPWFKQICAGLMALHQQGIVHRDLKPSNVLIDSNNVARIVDLGIAKPMLNTDRSITTTGSAPGTFAYMAPEQHNAPDTVDERADIFALGATFLELLTGQMAIGVCKPANVVNSTVPQGFSDLLLLTMSQNAADRPQNLADILTYLESHFPETLTVKSRIHDVAASNVVPIKSGDSATIGQVRNVRSEVIGAVIGAAIGAFATILLYRTVAPWVGYLVGVPAIIAAAMKGRSVWPDPNFWREHFIDIPDQEILSELRNESQRQGKAFQLQFGFYGDRSDLPVQQFLKTQRLWLLDQVTLFGQLATVMICVGLAMVLLRNHLPMLNWMSPVTAFVGWTVMCCGMACASFRKTYPSWCGLLLLPFAAFLADRNDQKLRVIESMLSQSDLSESPPSRLPKYFYWSALVRMALS